LKNQGLTAGAFILCKSRSLLDINYLCPAYCTLVTISLKIYRTVKNSSSIPPLDSAKCAVKNNKNKVQSSTHNYMLSKTYPWVQKLILTVLPDRLLKCINILPVGISVSLPRCGKGKGRRYGLNENFCVFCMKCVTWA
jgi:hypothetical protein